MSYTIFLLNPFLPITTFYSNSSDVSDFLLEDDPPSDVRTTRGRPRGMINDQGRGTRPVDSKTDSGGTLDGEETRVIKFIPKVLF